VAGVLISMPSARAAETSEPEVARFLDGRLREIGLAGAGIGVLRPDGSTWARGLGFSDRERQLAATADTPTSWASSGKVVVCAAIVKALEAKGISLDGPVSEHLPFAVVNPAFPEVPITFRMLLLHTSSIHHDRASSVELSARGDPTLPLGEFLREYLVPSGRFYKPTNYLGEAPGRRWEYSNVGFSLLGYLVERTSGVPFDEYCRRELFAPLGIRSAAWFLRDLDASRVAYQYAADPASPSGLKRVEHFSWPGYPDGSLRCSVSDMLRVLGAHLDRPPAAGGGVLSAAELGAIFTRAGVPGAWASGRNPLVTIDTGLAWRLYDLDGRRVWSHNGGGGAGMSTFLLLDREAGAAAAAWISGPVLETPAGQALFVELHHRLLAEMLRAR
jgi:CubicO group peptidase (beta-lactamase class C family)